MKKNKTLKYLYSLKYVKLFSYTFSKWLQRKIHNELINQRDKSIKAIERLKKRILKLEKRMSKLNNNIENQKYLKHDYKNMFYYGFNIIIGAINKGLLLMLAGLLFHALPQILVATLAFCLLRSFVGGLHFDSYTKCAWISLLCLVTIGLLAKYIPYNNIINLCVFIYLLIIALIYAPVEHKNRPLTDKKKIIFKYVSIVIIFALFSTQVLLNNDNISNCIMYGVLLSGIIALPIFKKVK